MVLMKLSIKKLINTAVVTSFVLGVLATPVMAGHRIQDNGGGTVSLESRAHSNIPEQATGTAKFKLGSTKEGVSRMTVKLTVRNLPERASRVYEVWLVDFSGTSLNLTAFDTDNNGDATTKVTRSIVNMAPYDRIVVTTKRSSSFNTSRQQTILSGRLH